MMQNRERNLNFYIRAANGETFQKIADDYNLTASRVQHLCGWMHHIIGRVTEGKQSFFNIREIRKEKEHWIERAKQAEKQGYQPK